MPVFARTQQVKLRSLLWSICILGIAFACLVGLKACFPLDYHEEIQRWSSLYELDPAWVATIIRCESNFRPNAVSLAGAVGLMQIMPTTGTWIAEQLEWNDPSNLSLQDGPTSIALGTWYLRYLLDRFDVPDTALIAYNAGPTHAAQWSDDLEQLFPETQRYIQRVHLFLPVYRTYFQALWLIDLIPSVHLSY